MRGTTTLPEHGFEHFAAAGRAGVSSRAAPVRPPKRAALSVEFDARAGLKPGGIEAGGWREIAARLVGGAARTILRRLRPGGGSSLPGLIALRLAPRFLASARGFGLRVVITGTNGKTGAAYLISRWLEDGGWRVTNNLEGANLPQGLAAALIEAHGGANGALVLEVDESTLPRVIADLAPNLVVVTSLFRDQLDRYGEVTFVQAKLREAIARSPSAKLLLNADDPLVASLGEPGRSEYYALSGLPDLDVPADATGCPRCGKPLEYSVHSYAHLGNYLCPNCGFTNPPARFTAQTTVDGFSLNGQPLAPLPEAWHPYSATAALAALTWLSGETPGGDWPRPPWGRGVRANVGGREVMLMLVKNPASLSWHFATHNPAAHVLTVDDLAADGRDVSWFWDVTFRLAHAEVSGRRRLELLSRLRYLDPPVSAAAHSSTGNALATACANVPDGAAVLMLSSYSGLRPAETLLRTPPAARAHPPEFSLPSPPSPERRDARLRLLHLYPRHMGTYGDAGNIEVLRRRLQWRGFQVEVLSLEPGEPFPPDVDAFMLGGGEDSAQQAIAASLAEVGPELAARIADGLPGLLVCGGLQMLGLEFHSAGGLIPGLGILPLSTRAPDANGGRREPKRLVGRLAVKSPLCPEIMVGFENHSGRTTLHGDAPLGAVLVGHGNAARGVNGEGVIHEHVIGTYLHGPVFARNPWLADHLLGWVLERRGLGALDRLDDRIEREAARRILLESGA